MREFSHNDVPRFGGRPLIKNPVVPEGKGYCVNLEGGEVVVVGPLTFWSLTHGGRRPFETAYCPGMAELRREQRRAAKAPKPLLRAKPFPYDPTFRAQTHQEDPLVGELSEIRYGEDGDGSRS